MSLVCVKGFNGEQIVRTKDLVEAMVTSRDLRPLTEEKSCVVRNWLENSIAAYPATYEQLWLEWCVSTRKRLENWVCIGIAS